MCHSVSWDKKQTTLKWKSSHYLCSVNTGCHCIHKNNPETSIASVFYDDLRGRKSWLQSAVFSLLLFENSCAGFYIKKGAHIKHLV